MPRTVAVWSGAVVAGDAISNSLRDKLVAIRRWDPAGSTVRAVGIAQGSDGSVPGINVYADAASALRSGIVGEADLHIFEYGIYYELFDLALLVPRERLAAVYHNVTPAALIDDPAVRVRVERALERRENLRHARRIFCDSAFNADDLRSLGFSEEALRVQPLPPAIVAAPGDRRGLPTILFVGRIVPAKGIADLVAAADDLRATGRAFRLAVAGNRRLSDADLIASLLARPGIDVIESPSDSELAALYAAADIVVIPSYHEGYCVPALEALLAGCQVVASDAGNLPDLVGPVGQCVPVGDVSAISAALAAALDAVPAVRAGADVVVPVTGGTLDGAARRARLDDLRLETARSTVDRAFLDDVHDLLGSPA